MRGILAFIYNSWVCEDAVRKEFGSEHRIMTVFILSSVQYALTNQNRASMMKFDIDTDTDRCRKVSRKLYYMMINFEFVQVTPSEGHLQKSGPIMGIPLLKLKA